MKLPRVRHQKPDGSWVRIDAKDLQQAQFQQAANHCRMQRIQSWHADVFEVLRFRLLWNRGRLFR